MYHHFLYVLWPIGANIQVYVIIMYLDVASVCWYTYLILGGNTGSNCQDASECSDGCNVLSGLTEKKNPSRVEMSIWVMWVWKSSMPNILLIAWVKSSHTLKQSLQNDMKCLPTGICTSIGHKTISVFAYMYNVYSSPMMCFQTRDLLPEEVPCYYVDTERQTWN